MAGFYSDVPGPKIAYDVDGTVGFRVDSGSQSTLSAGELQNLNDESALTVVPNSNIPEAAPSYLGLIFPDLRDIVGWFMATKWASNRPTKNLQTSTNTTNGTDGTWTTRVAGTLTQFFSDNGVQMVDEWRTGIQTVSWSGIKAVRWDMSNTGSPGALQVASFHIYGSLATGETPNRLRLWHPTLDQELGAADLDFGDVPRVTAPVKTFRVKNNSSSLTANSIVVSREVLFDPSPALLGALTIDNAGSGYGTSQNIGTLAPGAISGLISLKLDLDNTARLGLGRQRIKAVAGSWS